ncbi:MAG TPA: M20 family metallo-hydrolase [Chloroflexi bacterium]|nr:M20 family metallo-hydrolase [Chloroflexota bacterium]
MFSISIENIKHHFSILEKIGNLGTFREAGFLRASWSDEETAAMEYIKAVGRDHGLRTAYDGVGNLLLTTPGSQQGIIQIGSHLDTAPYGGNYDGAAGIVAGLEAILALKEQWPALRRRLELVVWRGEESATFGAVCKGSQAAFGQNDPNILLKKFNGQTLEEAIRGQGFDPGFIERSEAALPQSHIDSITAHLELHIEQARKLELDQKEIGIVTSVRGTIRFRIVVVGEAAHSGGTPMGVQYRKDANLAMAYMQVELDKLAGQALTKREDLVQTVGVVNTDRDFNVHNLHVYENALTKVSPYGYFTLDIRSNKLSFLENYAAQAQETIQAVARRFNVFVKIQQTGFLLPIEEMDKTLQKAAVDACRSLKYDYEMMPSGAIHDVAVVAAQKRSNGSSISGGLLFIPCKNGLSHNPKEYASPEAIQKGAMVLAQTLDLLLNKE